MILRSKKLVIFVGVLLVAIVLAHRFGLMAAKYVAGRRAEVSRQTLTTRIVDQMQTITVGDTLPDYGFTYSEQRKLRLSDLIRGETLIIFIDDQCPYCLEELQTLVSLDTNGSLLDRVILISSHAPVYSDQELADRLFGVPIMIDDDNTFRGDLNIYTQPFNIVVDSSLIISKIFPTKLSEQEVRDLIH